MAPPEDSFPLPFSSQRLDRGGEHRKDEAFLKQAAAAPGTRFLLLRDGATVPVDDEERLVWSRADALDEDAALTFLGIDAAGEALFSARGPEATDGGDRRADGARYAALREVGPAFAHEDAEAAVHAAALLNWHEHHSHCARCGAPTSPAEGGHIRRCEACDTAHFPRTDPAVIMLVSDGERCVLGRRIGAAAGRWSTLAGFVDPGESLEAAVAREVFEEVGLRVASVRYRGSQPWPFPSQLMLAFEASAEYAALVGNDEHHEVRWFTRSEVAEGMTGRSMTLPGPVSAGHALIRSWLG